MAKQPCLHCGLPTWVPDPKDGAATIETNEPARPVFCCTGCALAHRILRRPDEAGEQSVTPLQMVACVVGFAAFNQGVFWLLQILLQDEGKASLAQGAGYVSLGLGVLVWCVLVFGQAGGQRPKALDNLVWGLTAAGIVLAWVGQSALCGLLATLGLTLWSLRGFIRRRSNV